MFTTKWKLLLYYFSSSLILMGVAFYYPKPWVLATVAAVILTFFAGLFNEIYQLLVRWENTGKPKEEFPYAPVHARSLTAEERDKFIALMTKGFE